ncbi:hypothetical protein D1632_10165 [Chryseobacterium nematophagum]|uniref:Peptidase n=1 Tax=Chryseobacterium nematophagum TaxID=2305228 RepID=A0A3M7LB30_9FLAO|nr:murein L,D-transpeptidase catalytic domain family protein [Chryseobacterium nematophagum]RMZ59953.1 hypothetical protein D1632_10165 [Chryseobacterium nematophagum]
MMKHFLFIFFLLISHGTIEAQYPEGLPQEAISEVKNYIKGKDYNQNVAIFINFKIHSGKYRYFFYDLKKDSILQKAIVAHGSGSENTKTTSLTFSNINGSYQSSLGKFEVGESYIGKFGKAYRLKGLDSTNNNAMERAIVLHSYYCVPDKESRNPTCLSLGCPMLSQYAFNQSAKYIDGSKQPIILYAFY